MSCQPPWKETVYNWLKFNQSCLLCNETTDTQNPICTPCETELPWLVEHCLQCALPLPTTQLICGQCLKQPPPFTRVIAPWTYRFPVDSLISRFKHNSKWPFGRLLAALLAQALHDRFNHDLPRPDTLLPVPMTAKRFRQRGYNQAAMLARWLSDSLDIAIDEQSLLRVKETPAQQELDAKARKRNLLQAFALAPQAQLEGRHVALVDDVLTTGATAINISQLLLRSGARRVDIYCLARTPKPGETV